MYISRALDRHTDLWNICKKYMNVCLYLRLRRDKRQRECLLPQFPLEYPYTQYISHIWCTTHTKILTLIHIERQRKKRKIDRHITQVYCVKVLLLFRIRFFSFFGWITNACHRPSFVGHLYICVIVVTSSCYVWLLGQVQN